MAGFYPSLCIFTCEVRLLFFDIHSHIIPAVDDGSSNIEESIELLKLMKAQGITHVIATPHFYPEEDNLADFSEMISSAFSELEKTASKYGLPKVYRGCEMLYFKGIGNSTSLSELCLNGSSFLLLELTEASINDDLFEDIRAMRENSGIIPIIAHVERYCKARNYKKFLKFIKAEGIPTQINASSLSVPVLYRAVSKLLKSGLVFVIATDTHSVEQRPPMLSQAMKIIEEKFGSDVKKRLIKNSHILFEKIVSKRSNL